MVAILGNTENEDGVIGTTGADDKSGVFGRANSKGWGVFGFSEKGGGWHMALRLGCTELQNLDLIPFTVDLLKKLRVSDSHLSSLLLIITELVNNAIDHGLLKLDSKLKDDMNGFDLYLDQRDQRLANLAPTATLELVFDHEPTEQGSQLLMRVKDSGDGFDHVHTCNLISDDFLKHGRGIGLVQKIAKKLEYQGKGNEVLVTYSF